jgi:abhydrolase domain-containing protein 6
MAGILLFCGQVLAGGQAVEPVSRFVTVDGLSIHYLEAGRAAPDDPTLLMVHGWCGTAEDFRPLMRALPEFYHTISVDFPGSGLSAKPDAPYDCAYIVAFLRSFCVSMDLRSFIMVGHSMGGQFAVHYVTRWPQTVRSLILIDPYGLAGEEGGMLPLARLGPLVDIGFALNNRLFIQWATQVNVLYKPSYETLNAVADSTAASILNPEGARAAARITKSVIGRDQIDGLLPAISMDTLVMWGDHDLMLPPHWAQRYISLLPSARLVMIPDTGHMPMTERPTLAAIAIMGFLSQEQAVDAGD